MMTVNKDWLAYVLEPHSLIQDLEKLSDDFKVRLMRSFLSQAECHDRRLSFMPVSEEENSNCKNPPSPLSSPLNAIPITYDKSKTLDCLAVIIAAHFRFNVNIFAGVVTEMPLRLASRLYRMLFHTLLERNSRGSAESGGACTTPYDMGPWPSLEPTLAFATLVYHLWCLQVSLSESMLSQPNRDMTPAVWGLSEVPDQAFLQDSRADREALFMRHEESSLRVHDLLRRLQTNEFSVSVARPTPASLATASMVSEEVTLPSSRLLAGTAFILGRLAFQHNLLEKAMELFVLAHKSIIAAKLEYVEEAGMTPILAEKYMACCQQHYQPLSPTAPTPMTSDWCLVDSFCIALRQSLDSDDPEFFTLLSSSVTSPLKANLRGSSPFPSPSSMGTKKTTGKGTFSQDDLVNALEADVSTSDSAVSQLGFGLRRCLQLLVHEALVTLAARCTKSPRKEVTQLKKIFHDWQLFYTRVVVNNGLKSILQFSSAQSAAFCKMLLLAVGEDDAPSIDVKEAANLVFTGLSRFVHGDADRRIEVVNFVSHLIVRIRLVFSARKPTAVLRAATVFVAALAGTPLMSLLPKKLQDIVEVLQKDQKLIKRSADDLFGNLPDVSAGCVALSPLLMTQSHRSHSYSVSPFSLLITSSNPNIVINACNELLNGGSSVETILRSGGWIDTVLLTVLKWTTASDLNAKQRRDASLTGGFSPPSLYEFLAVVSENGKCCLPALLLLLRAIDLRREQGDGEVAAAFRLAANHVLLSSGQGGSATGSNSGPLWQRSLYRWIRGVAEHEAVIVDLLQVMNCNGFSSNSRNDEIELVNRCKIILVNDLASDVVVSDDLVSCAVCYILIKKPTFLSTISGGPPMLEFLTRLYKLSVEKEKLPHAVRDVCINRLSVWLRPTLNVPSSFPPPLPLPSRISRDPRHMTAFTDGRSSGTAIPNTPLPSTNIEPLRFLIRLFTQLQGNEVHRSLLDCLINCLAACLMSVQPLFKTDTIGEPWLSLPPLSGVVPQVVMDLLNSALSWGISLAPPCVKYLRLQADLLLVFANADPRIVLSLILQAAASASDYFAQPVPSSVFTERTLTTMIKCCKSLGYIGEAIVLCQFGPERSALITTGFQIIDSLRCDGDLVLPYTFNFIDEIAAFLWNLDLLEALANVQFFNCSQSKRANLLRCINQPEVNASNSREVLQMTRNKQAAEFLRHLCNQIFT